MDGTPLRGTKWGEFWPVICDQSSDAALLIQGISLTGQELPESGHAVTAEKGQPLWAGLRACDQQSVAAPPSAPSTKEKEALAFLSHRDTGMFLTSAEPGPL